MNPSAESVPSVAVIEGIADAVIYADTEGVIRLRNPGAVAVFGFDAAEAIGQSLDLIIPERFRAAHWKGFDAAIERGGTEGGRRARLTRGVHKDTDRKLYVEMSFAVVVADGLVTGSVAVARDVTERHLASRAAPTA